MTPYQIMGETWSPDRRRRFADEQADRHNQLRREGFKVLPSVPAAAIDEVVKALGQPPVRDGLIDRWSTDFILAQPLLKAIAFRPDVILEAAMHIGAIPRILDVSLWQTNPGDGGDPAAQKWHRDMDDWRACKLFVYLTDVGPKQGPHMFVPGSHRAEFFDVRGWAPDRFFTQAGRGLDATIDAIPHFEMQGAAGMTFLENTYCFHRGKPVEEGHRIIFQVCYGLMEIETMLSGTMIPSIRAAWG